MSSKKRREMDTDWASLPESLLDAILEKLPTPSWSCFSKVCKSWNTVSLEACSRNPMRVCRPLLVFQGSRTSVSNFLFCSVIDEDEEEHGNKTWLYNNNNKLTSSIPIPGKGQLHGSYQDWMILCHYNDQFISISVKKIICFFTLLNPFTGANIKLPRFTSIDHTFLCYKLFLSCPPLLSNCVYMLAPHENPRYGLYLCTQRSKTWCHFSLDFLEPLCFLKGASTHVSEQSFCLLTQKYHVVVIKFSDALKAIKAREDEGREEALVFTYLRAEMPRTVHKLGPFAYIVDSCGGILVVLWFFGNNNATSYEIYRLDKSSSKWVKSDGLGSEKILCLSTDHNGNSKILFDVKDWGVVKGNLLYFRDSMGSGGTYSFKEKRLLDSFTHHPPFIHLHNPIWLIAPQKWCLNHYYNRQNRK